MTERSGVRVGDEVRDLDGTDLGRVTRLYAWGFEVGRGFPILFRRQAVVRYDEVRGVRDGTLVVARSSRDLRDLAEGGVPASWRIPAPHAYPTAATPSEARFVLEDIAAGAIATDDAPAPLPPRTRPIAPLTREDERRAVDARGQVLPPPPDLARDPAR